MFEFKYGGWNQDYPDQIPREEWFVMHKDKLVGIISAKDRVNAETRSIFKIVLDNQKQLVKEFYDHISENNIQVRS